MSRVTRQGHTSPMAASLPPSLTPWLTSPGEDVRAFLWLCVRAGPLADPRRGDRRGPRRPAKPIAARAHHVAGDRRLTLPPEVDGAMLSPSLSVFRPPPASFCVSLRQSRRRNEEDRGAARPDGGTVMPKSYLLVCGFLFAWVVSSTAGAAIVGTTWEPIGPTPIHGMFNGGVVGRASAIAVNPTNGNQIWLGTASGGVWYSGDGGHFWAPLTDDQDAPYTNEWAFIDRIGDICSPCAQVDVLDYSSIRVPMISIVEL